MISVMEFVTTLFATLVGGALVIGGQWFADRRRERHELRMVALERRLEVHQQAYVRWRDLRRVGDENVSNEEANAIILASHNWWIANNLYLETRVRGAFDRAISAAMDRRSFLRAGRGHPRSTDDLRHSTALFNDVECVGRLIAEAMMLPPLRADREPSEPPQADNEQTARAR